MNELQQWINEHCQHGHVVQSVKLPRIAFRDYMRAKGVQVSFKELLQAFDDLGYERLPTIRPNPNPGDGRWKLVSVTVYFRSDKGYLRLLPRE